MKLNTNSKNQSILYHLHVLDEQHDAYSDLSEYPC